MPTSSDPDAPTELIEVPEDQSSEEEIVEAPTQPIALFELPPSKP